MFRGKIDWVLVGAILGLVLIGSVAIMSAAAPLPYYSQILRRHFLALGVGIGFVALLLLLSYADHGAWLGAFCICLAMEVVLLYICGHVRWLTLNMTSLSGLVVLMGISVDNLILFFEEFRNLASADPTVRQQDVTDDLTKAFSQEKPIILLANLTTVATLAPLYFLEGPIKDLVKVMMLGIGVAVGVNVYYARTLLLGSKGFVKKLDALSPASRPLISLRFDLFSFRYVLLGVYAVAVAASIGLLASRGLNLGIDFKEVTEIALHADQDVGADNLRASASEFFGERCEVRQVEPDA